MADAAPAPDDLEAAYRQMLQQTLAPQPVPQPQGPTASSHEGRGWLSLLGEALGGGQQYGTTEERESGGIRALGALGQRMLAASDYSYTPHTLGSIIGQGMGAAGESLAQTGSVDASRVAALQDYQQKQQEMQLARVKEAVPILTQLQTLRQAAEARRLLGGGGTTPGTTPGTSIGAVSGDTYEGAIGGHEGLGSDPRLPSTVGGFRPDTWQGFVTANPDLFKGMSADQIAAARSDPKLNAAGISWLAKQNADALTKAGVEPSGPALGVAHYVGAGAAAKILKAPDNAAVKDFVSADAVKYNPELATMTVGQLKARYAAVPAPAFLAAKPAAVAADGKPIGDPTKPELAPGPPGSTVSGPPVSLGSAIGAIDAGKPQYTVAPPPSGKGTPLPAGRLATSEIDPNAVSGNVEAIQAGRQRAQLAMQQPDGSVLAAGPAAGPTPAQGGFGSGASSYGTTPAPTALAAPQAPPPQTPPVVAPTPPAVTAPQAPPIAPFVYERGPLPPTIQSRIDNPAAFVSPDLTTAMQVAGASGDIAKMAAAKAAVGAAADTVRSEALKAAEDYHTNERNKQQEFRQKQIDAQQAIQLKQIEADNSVKLKEEEGRQTRLTNKEAVFNQANQKGLETAQTDQAAARSVVAQLEGFRNISEGVGQPGWLQTTKWPGSDHTVAEQLQQAGIPVADTGGAQLLKGGMINIVKALREGMPMGSLSDRDLSFIERMGPTEWMDPDTRAAAIGYLLQANRAKMRFASDVQKEMSRGKNYGDAVDAVDARSKPFVPRVPADLTAHWTDDTQEWSDARKKWSQDNDAGPGTLIHMDDGRIVVLKRPPRKDRGQG